MREIQLTRGWCSIVDDDDYERINAYSWTILPVKNRGNFYAIIKKKYRESLKISVMHRFIMNVSDANLEVDHINHDTLDNRKANLRVCTKAENLRNKKIYRNNKSGFKGVYVDKGKYIRMQIRINGKYYRSSSFATIEDAAMAYDKMALNLHGEFALLNFPNVSA